jgi:flagellin
MVAYENVTASESRIRDADMAEEVVNFTTNQVLMQSSLSMLAQANMQTQSVLRLLNH